MIMSSALPPPPFFISVFRDRIITNVNVVAKCPLCWSKKALASFWATGSAEELPPRIRANPRGYARTPPGSARIRRTSAKNIFRRTPPNVRRTSGGHRRTPRGYGRIRADSAANWRKSSLEKCPPTKTSLTPRLVI